ncbi:hypothetical protein [Heyndrickxia oleronia]|uniref:Uncharacterized protein n=1 Tax=Heyndrickxia oleronia TaxID=38875 RepID=A0AAW6T2H9_9BACI|nr:hypothetical protein [Heyndrickxia oleronia]MBB2483446.1 hypothetical protein [Bacillus sp. APMAM]MDH5163282.1 hypothetical protein [Heyndrickxia oleronia]RTZ53131.1 hypothetical protein EKO25_25065 [Bacillus sp. SAJ1]GIN41501.1 hypothetical protein J19TS1_44500 [Heyndrickxia oleronia]
MYYLKFFIYHFLLFAGLMALNFYFVETIRNQPFSIISIVAIIIIVLLAISAFGWGDKLQKCTGAIRLRDKLLLSFLASVLAFFFLGLLIGGITF